eukprot:CAMPEP_0117602938 /NCGR_PEP_ID=MMETSP0784-20121206/77855_1 /TAXON_ID=39447 /ORGANISM="" /LENGTH=221 /DNA_ID=CAMNT_0005405805 /DNA_START=217 /DNA_END=883 /DNA_ORIENTATION=-
MTGHDCLQCRRSVVRLQQLPPVNRNQAKPCTPETPPEDVAEIDPDVRHYHKASGVRLVNLSAAHTGASKPDASIVQGHCLNRQNHIGRAAQALRGFHVVRAARLPANRWTCGTCARSRVLKHFALSAAISTPRAIALSTGLAIPTAAAPAAAAFVAAAGAPGGRPHVGVSLPLRVQSQLLVRDLNLQDHALQLFPCDLFERIRCISGVVELYESNASGGER